MHLAIARQTFYYSIVLDEKVQKRFMEENGKEVSLHPSSSAKSHLQIQAEIRNLKRKTCWVIHPLAEFLTAKYLSETLKQYFLPENSTKQNTAICQIPSASSSSRCTSTAAPAPRGVLGRWGTARGGICPWSWLGAGVYTELSVPCSFQCRPELTWMAAPH